MRQLGSDHASRSWAIESLECRTLLTAILAPPDPVITGDTFTTALPPMPGHSFYVSTWNAQGGPVSQLASLSAITPNTTNDLVLNATPTSTNYVGVAQGAGGIGAPLLTNGLTQTQVAPAPNFSSPAVGDGQLNDASNNANVIADTSSTYFFTYQLGTVGGATANPNGYDLSEIDVMAGHNDARTQINLVDVLVEPVGSSTFLSLSGSAGFSLVSAPDANGDGGVSPVLSGSSQMAIVNDSGGTIVHNIQAVEFLVLDPSTWIRELVVTGTPSVSAPPATGPTQPSGVAAGAGPNGTTVTWNASDNAAGYTVLRSTTGTAGTFAVIGSVVGTTSFIDGTAQRGTSYFYQVTASGTGDSIASATSASFTPVNGLTANVFTGQSWGGAVNFSESIPQPNYQGGPNALLFPLGHALNANAFSVMITGKITTDAGGVYTFQTNTDDDGYLYINGQLVSSDPGSHSTRLATALVPITLAASTSYNLMFIEDNRGVGWSIQANWKKPGSSAFTPIPADHLTPTSDVATTPQSVSATIGANKVPQVSWTTVNDFNSYQYVVQRATVNSGTGLPGTFSTIATLFSGPLTLGAAGPATWGPHTYLDTAAPQATTFDYKVGVVPIPGAAISLSSQSSPVTTPGHSLSVSVSGDGQSLNVVLDRAGEVATLSVTGTQVNVNDQTGTSVFNSTLPGTVKNLNVTGIGSALPNTLTINNALSIFSGTISVNSVSDVTINGAVTTGSVDINASNNININSTITASGTVNLDADSDNSSSGTMTVGSTAAINTNGHLFSAHGARIAISSFITTGAAGALYSFSPLWSATNVLSETVTSGTLTIQFASGIGTGSVAWSGPSNSGLTGTVFFNLPGVDFSTSGLTFTSGNANLQVLARTIDVTGATNIGAGSVTFAGRSIVEGSLTAGAIQFAQPAGAQTPQVFTTPPATAPMTINASVTCNGPLTLGGAMVINSPGVVTLSGDLSLAGNSITLNGGTIHFLGSHSIAGPGSILFASNLADTIDIKGSGNTPATLTVGSDVTIMAPAGSLATGLIDRADFLTDTIVNQGTIEANQPGFSLHVSFAQIPASGGLFASTNGSSLAIDSPSGNLGSGYSVTGTGSSLSITGGYTIDQPLSAGPGSTLTLEGFWTNTSTVSANDATLVLETDSSTWVNNGTITATDSTLMIGGDEPTAAVQSLDVHNCILNLTGTVENLSGATFTLNGLNWNLLGGEIRGDTVTGPGSLTIPDGQSGGLDGVVLSNATLNIGENSTINLLSAVQFAAGASVIAAADTTWNLTGNESINVGPGQTMTINALQFAPDTNLQLVNNGGTAIINPGVRSFTVSVSGNGSTSLNMGSGAVDLIVAAGCNATVNFGASNADLTIDGAGNTLLVLGTGNPNIVFANAHTGGTGSIAGVVFNDADDNGHRGAGELGLAGRKLFIDLNHNGRLDTNEPTTVAAADGSYHFTGLAAGNYLVRETMVAGWRPTTAASLHISLSNGQAATGKNFGQTSTARISGLVFDDKNANHQRNAGEEPLAGRIVYIDTNHNGKLDAGERHTLTGADGRFVFDGLAAGAYVIREIAPSGWTNIALENSAIVQLKTAEVVSNIRLAQRRVK
ncbi:MAG TPA: SdrD B-like domain-containing protein [Humisphaera sp.]|nr:SdrD B-like domain-containing protein [Humisphaera sp.]